MALTDNDTMPFGAHKGKKMANVPDHYLRWLYTQIEGRSKIHWTLTDKLLHEYITENKDTLKIK